MRWVTANKGDALRPNVRCRLVAKHLAAKYGGKDVEDRFAAMPPFELVKALLVKASQRRDRKKTIRKVMLIDVSKAHLYAPVWPGDKAYVALPPECEKPGVCGLLGFWLYGMRPASHGWQEEYTRQLEKSDPWQALCHPVALKENPMALHAWYMGMTSPLKVPGSTEKGSGGLTESVTHQGSSDVRS